jgi:hypothetical protein
MPVIVSKSSKPFLKTEVIRKRDPWKGLEAVECATLGWVSWFDTRRLLEPIGNIPPAEFENTYHTQQEGLVVGRFTDGLDIMRAIIHVSCQSGVAVNVAQVSL